MTEQKAICKFNEEKAHYIIEDYYLKKLLIDIANEGNKIAAVYQTAQKLTDYHVNQTRSRLLLDKNWKHKQFMNGDGWKLANIGRTALTFYKSKNTGSEGITVHLSVYTVFQFNVAIISYQLPIYEDGLWTRHEFPLIHSDMNSLKQLIDAHLNFIEINYKVYSYV